MKKIAILLILVLMFCVIAKGQQPITDGNGDGIVDLQDFSALAGDWLGAGYAGLETNCRIDIGFYAGNGSSQDTIQQINHYLGRVPNFIMVFSLSPTYNITPAIILTDPLDSYTKIKFFNSRDCDIFTSLMPIYSDVFTVTNISSDQGYWLNKNEGRYMYVAVSQEMPAMQMMAMAQAFMPAEAKAVEAIEDAEDVADAEEERLTTFLQELDEWIAQLDDPDMILSLQEIRNETVMDLSE